MPDVDVSGIRLYYESSGDGDPMLLLHGLGSSTRDWEHQVSYFAKRYRVIVPDLRGHGMSDKPPKPCSIALFASDIAQLLSELDIASAHVVGLSFGGFVGFQLAVDHPDLVRSLTVVNSAPALPRNSFGDRLLVAWALFVRRLIVHLFGMRTLGRFLSKKLFPRPDQEAHKQTFVDRWAQNDSRAYLAALAAVSRWSVEARLGSIYCPTCVIFGERDFVRRALKRGYMAKLPNADLVVIPDSGHFTPLDASKRFNDAVISFLEKQERARH